MSPISSLVYLTAVFDCDPLSRSRPYLPSFAADLTSRFLRQVDKKARQGPAQEAGGAKGNT